jgi:hypothetical protein
MARQIPPYLKYPHKIPTAANKKTKTRQVRNGEVTAVKRRAIKTY